MLIFIFGSSLAISQHWEVYNTENTVLTSNTFSEIVVDDNNISWVGTKDGLAKIENGELSLFNSSNSILPTQQVRDIFLDKSNLIWILYGNRIYRGRNGNFELYKSDLGGHEIVANSQGILYVASGIFVLKIRNKLVTDTIHRPDEDLKIPVGKMVIDQDENLWLIFSSSWQDLKKITFNTQDDSFSSKSVGRGVYAHNIAVDSNNNIWISGRRHIKKRDREKGIWVDMLDSLGISWEPNKFFNSLTFDKDNNIIITNTTSVYLPAELHIIDNQNHTLYNYDSLYNEDIFNKLQGNISVDKNGNILINAVDQGLFRFVNNTTSVNESTDNGINIYPNPAQNKLHLDTGNKIVKSISISDILGNELIDIDYNYNNPNTLDISTLATGTYFINVMFDDGSSSIEKFVKE